MATDAAKAGEMEIVKTSLQRITHFTNRNRVAHEATRQLAKRGLRKQAIEIAKTMDDVATRDRALSELAQ